MDVQAGGLCERRQAGIALSTPESHPHSVSSEPDDLERVHSVAQRPKEVPHLA